MDKEEIIIFIQKRFHDDLCLDTSCISKEYIDVFNKAQELFGSWDLAVDASDLPYKPIFKPSKWTKEKIIDALQNIPEEDLVDKHLRTKYSSLYSACISKFGSRKKAFLAAGIDYESTLQNIPWTKDRIISTIQLFYLKKIPINFKYINTYNSRLRKRAEKFFGSWGSAVSAAGIDYEEVKKNKGWGKPFVGDDGVLYSSQIEGLIANKLFGLKTNKLIIDYKPQAEVSHTKNWTCDFLITLLNGANLWLEIEDRGKRNFEEKINFYDKIKVPHCKVFSPTNIESIVERYTKWFTIPCKNTLITSHKNPDGDALSSVKAVYEYLKQNNKKVVVKLSGTIPKNLEWIIEDIEIIKEIPTYIEQVVVLDCAPTKDRIGWEVPLDIPIFNIDHHVNRLEFNNPDNDIHIINASSTSIILFNYFGLKNNILAVGAYTDTLFMRNLTETFNFIVNLNIDEEILAEYITRITSNPDRKLWKMLNDSSIHRCRNGFIIVETSEEIPDLVESFMQILSKLSESVCLIFGKNNDVKLRTSNKNLDLSTIAKKYDGGGHAFASMCNVKDKIAEFKADIISLNVQKMSINLDGYGEEKC